MRSTAQGSTKLRTSTRLFLSLVLFSIGGTLLSHLTGLRPGWIAPVAAMVTLLAGFWSICALCTDHLGTAAWKPVLLVLAVGAFAEVTGLYTGFPFGTYRYSQQWWPVVPLPGGLVFPLLLPFAWFLMAGSAYLYASRWLRGWSAVLAGAILATACDAPMEGVITQVLGYWDWTPPGPVFGAPILNSGGWLLTSFAAGALLHFSGLTEPQESRESVAILGGHMVLMMAIGWIRSGQLLWAVLLGVFGAWLLWGLWSRKR